MAGTKAGGKLAAQTNKQKYGSDFYAKIGKKGGKLGKTGGFFANRELASTAGRKGGLISRRGGREFFPTPGTQAEINERSDNGV